ncbi:PspC domain-containing protein [Conexibacter sp. JD483]|uniref:ATP-binding protein n=1 Tax=unclassified Conexibacter TaxID=2627773 RepID=UPI00271BB3A2|nr:MULTISPECIES: ATP-binding protein [unclassified Conexibacter]MDO8186440.1 PspC domain-containing protein [Conexibacter sp. CPCC 205706]MDO8200009.1 PspC domain-containing protein [Conexibacter sp. CPCC 205762]MDR9370562.1 PspC domain-containing protein [Conexibacter sp. JD483]
MSVQRSAADRLLFGVCAGIARSTGADVLLVRLAVTALLVVTGGVGLVAYAALVVLLPAEPGPITPWSQRSRTTPALLLVFGAVLYALGLHVVTPPLSVLVPAALLTAGVVLVWRETTRAREAGTRLERVELLRLGAGLALLVGGAVSFLTDSGKLAELSSALIAAAVVSAGLGLIVGPQLAQARAEADTERRLRIRADERADVAARLHDSVLQTLALIQREEDPRRAQSLARRQERELRGWLYGGEAPGDAATLASALRTATAEVEEHYGIEVDLVQPSDDVLDEGLAALAAAAREAMTNAGRHAGVEAISVLARVTDDEASIYVRDAGRGFDPADVAVDRKGVRESIVGRMERCGGRAVVVSAPGAGTEVELVLPRTGS